MLSYSKRLRTGSLVTLRGGKVVRTGRGMKVTGVYQEAYTQTYLNDEGTHGSISVPRCVIVSGPMSVNVDTPIAPARARIKRPHKR